MTADAHFCPIFFPNTDPSRLIAIRLVQHCAAISAAAELLFETNTSLSILANNQ